MIAGAALFVGFLVYLVTGRILGLFLLGSWPGRWRSHRRAGLVFRIGSTPGVARPALTLLGAGGLGIGGWLLTTTATGSPWIGLPAGLLFAAIPLRRHARQRIQRLGEFQEAWPDGLRHLVASVRSGSTVEAAVLDLARTGPEPLQAALGRFSVLAPALGVVPALEAIRDEIADPTTDRVVEVLIVAHEIGGRVVPGVLEDLATAVTEDLRTVEEIRTTGFEQRLNARIVFAVPWALLVLLTSKPGPYRSFYQSRAGTTIVLAAALLSSIALIVVGRLGREPLERRFLVSADGEAA